MCRRKWTRFADKGGIGKAIGALDKLAEPDSHELMFIEGEHLIVLTHLCRLMDLSRLASFLITDIVMNQTILPTSDVAKELWGYSSKTIAPEDNIAATG